MRSPPSPPCSARRSRACTTRPRTAKAKGKGKAKEREAAPPIHGEAEEHQANDLGNRAVCLRKMDKLAESLELYDRVLAIPEADRAHLAPNRQTCLREMVEWTGTNGEYDAHVDMYGRMR